MANNVDITNLVLSMGSTDLHDRIGTVTEQTIGKVGETILSYTTVKNEFLDVLANKPFIIWKSSKFLEFVGTIKTWFIKFCNPLGFKKAVLNWTSEIDILYFLAKFFE